VSSLWAVGWARGQGEDQGEGTLEQGTVYSAGWSGKGLAPTIWSVSRHPSF
jgi:hypothetical protein